MTRYAIRNLDGDVIAIHDVPRLPNGKRDRTEHPTWHHPDGRISRAGEISAKALPLFGTHHVRAWDTSRPVFVVEGEGDAVALAEAGHRALGTITGAPACHDEAAFGCLTGFDVLLWADHDQVGREQMLKAARALEPIARSVLWVGWPDAQDGDGARDYLDAGLVVDDLVIAAVRVPVPPPAMRPVGNRRVPWRQVSLAPRSDVAPLARTVSQAGSGNRNAVLFWAAHKAADNGIGQEDAESVLLDAYLAAEPTPIREREGRATIRSAYRR